MHPTLSAKRPPQPPIQQIINQLMGQANMLAIDDTFLFTLAITVAALVLVLLIPIPPQPKGKEKPVPME